MKVKELIEKLQRFDGDREVYLELAEALSTPMDVYEHSFTDSPDVVVIEQDETMKPWFGWCKFCGAEWKTIHRLFDDPKDDGPCCICWNCKADCSDARTIEKPPEHKIKKYIER